MSGTAISPTSEATASSISSSLERQRRYIVALLMPARSATASVVSPGTPRSAMRSSVASMAAWRGWSTVVIVAKLYRTVSQLQGTVAPPSALESRAMTDAYADSGVDTSESARAIDALVGVLRTLDLGRPSRSRLASGHYAAVLEIAPNLGLALSTDGVGSKVIVAEQAGRYGTIGIDCIAMNVNDVVCVGAEPIAVLDYLAVERADPDVLRDIAIGLKAGAEAAGVEIPGGELAQLPELIRGHPSPHGFDLTGACVGLVGLDAMVTGERAAPGDVLLGLPSSGVHANGLTLARRALLGAYGLDDRPPELGGATHRRRPARADGDLRARGARAPAFRRPRPRPGPHHR